MGYGDQRKATLWRATAELPQYDRLRESATADVCVVGAGIAGLAAAYLLAKEGRQVLVLDDGEVGGGETGNTTAHLSNAFDDRYFQVEKLFDAKAARIVAASHTAAIHRIDEIARVPGIDGVFIGPGDLALSMGLPPGAAAGDP